MQLEKDGKTSIFAVCRKRHAYPLWGYVPDKITKGENSSLMRKFQGTDISPKEAVIEPLSWPSIFFLTHYDWNVCNYFRNDRDIRLKNTCALGLI